MTNSEKEKEAMKDVLHSWCVDSVVLLCAKKGVNGNVEALLSVSFMFII